MFDGIPLGCNRCGEPLDEETALSTKDGELLCYECFTINEEERRDEA